MKEDFTKEQLEAIRIVDSLYSLKNDCEKTDLKIHNTFKEKTNLLCRLKRNNENYTHYIPSLLFDLIDAIDKGDLIFKDA